MCADDFTSRGGHADGAIGAKSLHLDRLSIAAAGAVDPPARRLVGRRQRRGDGARAAEGGRERGAGELRRDQGRQAPRVSGGGGSFLPGHLGSRRSTPRSWPPCPVVNVLLGSVVGIGAAKAVLGHFSVMVRDIAQLFVAGPPVVSHAMGYDITKEDLGGWQVHCRNGSVDNLAETEEEAVAMTKRFLSYLPSSVYEAPPVLAPDPDDPADRREEELFTLIPRKRTTTFDVRRAIELMADRGSFFEIGPLWGTDQVAGFVRFNGHPVGVIASDSRHVNGGALTADGCDKLTRHLDLCDLFHLPVLNLVDNPGFAVGLEHEIAGTIRKGGEWMVAFAQVAGADLHRADAAQLRRRRQQLGDADPRSRRAGRVAGGRRRRHPAGRRHRGGVQAPAGRGRRPGRAARRARRPHRERPRPDRPAQPVPDRGDDRPPRHPPLRLRVGRPGDRVATQPAKLRRAPCSSGPEPRLGQRERPSSLIVHTSTLSMTRWLACHGSAASVARTSTSDGASTASTTRSSSRGVRRGRRTRCRRAASMKAACSSKPLCSSSGRAGSHDGPRRRKTTKNIVTPAATG